MIFLDWLPIHERKLKLQMKKSRQYKNIHILKSHYD